MRSDQKILKRPVRGSIPPSRYDIVNTGSGTGGGIPFFTLGTLSVANRMGVTK